MSSILQETRNIFRICSRLQEILILDPCFWRSTPWFMHMADGTYAMMTSSNRNIFRVTGLLSGEFTGHRRIPLTKASDAELWCFLWAVPEKQLSKISRRRWFETPSRYYDVTVMLCEKTAHVRTHTWTLTLSHTQPQTASWENVCAICPLDNI